LRWYFLFSRLEGAGEGVTNVLIDCQELLTSEVIAAMHTTEMSAAIKPYSMAVTPDWSLTKRVSKLFIEDFSALRTKTNFACLHDRKLQPL
jgi:hypothetical protein